MAETDLILTIHYFIRFRYINMDFNVVDLAILIFIFIAVLYVLNYCSNITENFGCCFNNQYELNKTWPTPCINNKRKDIRLNECMPRYYPMN